MKKWPTRRQKGGGVVFGMFNVDCFGEIVYSVSADHRTKGVKFEVSVDFEIG